MIPSPQPWGKPAEPRSGGGFGPVSESNRPLVEGRDQDLPDALRSLAEEKKHARVTHAYLVLKRFGLSIRTRVEVDRFLAWMNAEGLAGPTQSTSFSTIRSLQSGNKALRLVQHVSAGGCAE